MELVGQERGTLATLFQLRAESLTFVGEQMMGF